MKTKEVKIEIPKGFEVDKEKSTFERIVFKELSSPMQKVYDYHNTTEEEFDKLYENIPDYLKAMQKEILIVSFYNKGVQPDWNNNSQYKYYPYFDMQAFGYNCYSANFSVSSRLCFLRKEDLLEAVEKFLPEYKQSRLG